MSLPVEEGRKEGRASFIRLRNFEQEIKGERTQFANYDKQQQLYSNRSTSVNSKMILICSYSILGCLI